MKTSELSPQGELSVTLQSDSVFLGNVIPVEIRNSNLRLITKEIPKYGKVTLDEGLYQVSAVLEDGCRHSQLVQIVGGAATRLVFNAEEPEFLSEPYPAQQEAFAAPITTRRQAPQADKRARFTKSIQKRMLSAKPQDSSRSVFGGLESLQQSEPAAVPAPDRASMDSVQGATLLEELPDSWIFTFDTNSTSVATAVFKDNSNTRTLSLPCSPGGNRCVVRREENSIGRPFTAWISPERTVANAIQNMLSSGYLMQAGNVAKEAIELLRDKYDDPIGAVLGGLVLNKFDKLNEKYSWVENLAIDFPWLPDGKILLASLMWESRSNREVALNLAVDASKQRILFTESYSLLLDMLRRAARSAGQEAIDCRNAMASQSPDIDWDSICLSISSGKE